MKTVSLYRYVILEGTGTSASSSSTTFLPPTIIKTIAQADEIDSTMTYNLLMSSMQRSSQTAGSSSSSSSSPLQGTTILKPWWDGRIAIPNYTFEMAKEAIKPHVGICSPRGHYGTQMNEVDGDIVKFAFVHIYKTAGSTLREFFLYYSYYCSLGWSVIISCTKIKSSSIIEPFNASPERRLQQQQQDEEADFGTQVETAGTSATSNNNTPTVGYNYNNNGIGDTNIYWNPCKMKRLLQRNGKLIDTTNNNTDSRVDVSVVENYADIIGGHFKLGTADYLRVGTDVSPGYGIDIGLDQLRRDANGLDQPQQRQVFTSNNSNSNNYYKLRYITFVREPLYKYVSGVVFHHKQIKTQEEIITKIKNDVINERLEGKYWMRIGDYLLSPFQSSKDRKKDDYNKGLNMSSVEYKTQLILNNLAIKYNVIMGMTESMTESMDILQHILDNKNQMTPLFNHYKPTSPAGRDTTTTNATNTTRDDAAQDVGSGNEASKESPPNSTIANSTSDSTSAGQQYQRKTKELVLPKRSVVNKSRFSSKVILQEMQNDTEFFDLFVEYVKYEQLIYDYCKYMHTLQYNATKNTMADDASS